MTGFSAQWLAMREPYDAGARNPLVLAAVAAAFADRAAIRVVDLACGAGATMRAISAHLPARQSWRLVDHDRDLLARAASSASSAEHNVVTAFLDIARDLRNAFEAPVDLVTASALLDLGSADWLEALAKEIVSRSLPFYAALTYDGRMALTPADPLDASIAEAFNRHQRSDKGFGPALGPTAALAAIARFEGWAHATVSGKSDWALNPTDFAIQEELLAGLAKAALETGDLASVEVNGWLARRRAHIQAGRSSMRIGHTDFFVRPTAAR
jgi:hypothetical protein